MVKKLKFTAVQIHKSLDAKKASAVSLFSCLLLHGQQVSHEPAVCPSGQEGQWYPGVHLKDLQPTVQER